MINEETIDCYSLVSIIVPVFNIEKYVSRCINSLISQTYTNLEIILIDDGSSDQSGILCDQFAKKDNRIHVIHKKNEGLGLARNTGILFSTGQVISFVDGDDFVESNYVQVGLESLCKEKTQIAVFGYNSVNSKGKICGSFIPKGKKEKYENKEILLEIIPGFLCSHYETKGLLRLPLSAWCFFFSSKIIKDNGWLFFSERKYISEDFYSFLNLFPYIKSISIIYLPLYDYCFNPQSLTRKIKSDRKEKNDFLFLSMDEICNKRNYSKFIRGGIYLMFFYNLLGAYRVILFSEESLKLKAKAEQELINDKVLGDYMYLLNYKDLNLKTKIWLYLFKHKNRHLLNILMKFSNSKHE